MPSQDLSTLTPPEIMEWVADTFGERAGLSCSFGGPGGMVLAHMASQCSKKLPILFLDTDFLFDETYALKRQLEEEWGLTVRTQRAALTPDQQEREHGPSLWATNPDLCCALRKVRPMWQLLQDIDCWVTGLRRDQSSTRKTVAVRETHRLDDGRTILKVNPLASWTRRDVWAYIHRHDVPYNPLLDQGYSSIGCTHCTVPSTSGDERSGRWQGSQKTECGLHTFTKHQGEGNLG